MLPTFGSCSCYIIQERRNTPDSAGLCCGLPHSVKQSAVVLQPEQFVGRGHVVGDRLLPVEEEGVGGPDVAGQQVV